MATGHGRHPVLFLSSFGSRIDSFEINKYYQVRKLGKGFLGTRNKTNKSAKSKPLGLNWGAPHEVSGSPSLTLRENWETENKTIVGTPFS